ncbi:MAG: hypothetical protein MJZ30_09315 [Paludibacteraceae bacterium]|nr:hypothetical protein [Paludibacteraceae bacterium]
MERLRDYIDLGNGYQAEVALAGDYYKLTKNGETVYQDSANGDTYEEDSAIAFFEYWIAEYGDKE